MTIKKQVSKYSVVLGKLMTAVKVPPQAEHAASFKGSQFLPTSTGVLTILTGKKSSVSINRDGFNIIMVKDWEAVTKVAGELGLVFEKTVIINPEEGKDGYQLEDYSKENLRVILDFLMADQARVGKYVGMISRVSELLG